MMHGTTNIKFSKDKLLAIRISLSRFLELFLHMSKIAVVPGVIGHDFIKIQQLNNSSTSESQRNKLVHKQ